MSKCNVFVKASLLKVANFLSEELSIQRDVVVKYLARHPMMNYIKASNVPETLEYVRSLGFEDKVISESVSICFYPKTKVVEGFKEMRTQEKVLSKFGFNSGHVSKETNNFINGTVSRDKRLQLCLYYIELPFSFNGFGVV